MVSLFLTQDFFFSWDNFTRLLFGFHFLVTYAACCSRKHYFIRNQLFVKKREFKQEWTHRRGSQVLVVLVTHIQSHMIWCDVTRLSKWLRLKFPWITNTSALNHHWIWTAVSWILLNDVVGPLRFSSLLSFSTEKGGWFTFLLGFLGSLKKGKIQNKIKKKLQTEEDHLWIHVSVF